MINQRILQLYNQRNWQHFSFQTECWQQIVSGKSGLLNAPTGSGKTMAIFLGFIGAWLETGNKSKTGLYLLWVTPLKALSADLAENMQQVLEELNIPISLELRTSDTPQADKQRQQKKMPNILITTPESLHLLLSRKAHENLLVGLQGLVVDEWHELLGTKRGVMVELAAAYLKQIRPNLQIWGISATIANLEHAMHVLLQDPKLGVIVKAQSQKRYILETIIPETMEHFPWSGHLNTAQVKHVLRVINKHKTSIIFTNTRAQAEIWYRQILESAPELAGIIALHHSSLGKELRIWVEEALKKGTIKVAIATSSLDLGVDFHPVEAIIQIGSPKSLSRFIQRAGRSGHKPNEPSYAYFVPTNALEILDGYALRLAIDNPVLEEKIQPNAPLDVLVQFMLTLAVGSGLDLKQMRFWLFKSVSYRHITDADWEWCIQFLLNGGESLTAYEQFNKAILDAQTGKLIVESKRIALMHRMSIGTILADQAMQVVFQSGGWIGSIEETFVTKLKPGDNFWFAGRNLELVHVREQKVVVKLSAAKAGVVPNWSGGRMPLSGPFAKNIRLVLEEVAFGEVNGPEMNALLPLFDIQMQRSIIPKTNELLIETCHTKEGFHIFVYPFGGRLVHEGLAAMMAYRIGLEVPASFSMAMNDYGFEMLINTPIIFNDQDIRRWLSVENLSATIFQSINTSEMARRQFREIARIAGLTFQGFPGKSLKAKQLKANSFLFFDVFKTFEPNNPLLRQAYNEVLAYQLEEDRLRQILNEIATQDIIIKPLRKLTPLSFPIFADRLRQSLSTEKWEERLKKIVQLNQDASRFNK